MTKLKAFVDDKSNVANMMITLYDREENTVGKGENAGTGFSDAFLLRVVKSRDCAVKS